MTKDTHEVTVRRLGKGGYLHRIIPIVDSSGKIIQSVVKPLMVEFRFRDLMQVIVGSSILAIPAAYTEETWSLGADLPLLNVILLGLVSILFMASFVFFNFYREFFRGYVFEFLKRVFGIYFMSLLVVGILLTILQKCPWGVDNVLAVKRIIIVAFPASMSAAVTDALK